MMQTYLCAIMSMSISSQLTSNPMTIGAMVMISATSMLMVTLNLMTSMVTLLIFLIYIGGLMVMFSYFLSIQPNALINMWPIMTSLLASSLFILTTSPMLTPQTIPEMATPTTMITSINFEVVIILTMSLLITLIIVNSLSSKTNGPMRPFTFKTSKTFLSNY